MPSPSVNLSSIANKIKALLAKTQQSGCSESEALAAAAKARELMENYQLSMTDLEVQAEGAEVREVKSDPRGALGGLAKAIGIYCDCRAVRNGQRVVQFLGLRSDTDLATWLLGSLETYVMGAVIDWAMDLDAPPGKSESDAFVIAAFREIAKRLVEAKRGLASSPSRNALVVTKNALIAAHPRAWEFAGRTTNWGGAANSERASEAGRAAGQGANFARPVGSRVAGLIGRGAA